MSSPTPATGERAGRVVLGVDLGGTNVRAAVVGEDGALLGRPVQNSSEGRSGFERTVAASVRTIRAAIADAGCSPEEVRAVGMAVPGHVDGARGVVRWTPNLGVEREGRFDGWRDAPLGEALHGELGWPVYMGNDANLAALAEYRFGSGRDSAQGLVLLTLGTGIGGGVVLTRSQIQGRASLEGSVLLVGADGGGAELGHVAVLAGGPRCGCGASGCLEALANRDAIAERARGKLRRRPEGVLHDLYVRDPERLSPRLIAEAAARGDDLALEVWAETGAYVGIAVGGFINVFNPEIVAIGGQIAKAGEPLFGALRRAARDHAIPTLFASCRILPAERLDEAGVLGGAALALGMTSPAAR